jgi:hypothetical protein
VQEAVGFFRRKLQNPLRFSAEGDLNRGGNLLAEDRSPFDFLANALQRQVGAGEDPAGQTLPFSNQAEQEVLGLDRDASELACFVSREEEDTSRPFRIAFEHPVLPVV